VAAQPSQVRKVAVLPFRASTELIGSSASDIFGTALLRTGRYQLVERSQIAGVLGETELSMAGMSDSAAMAAGRMLGAEGVILGTVDEYGTIAYRGKTYPVVGASVRMIDCSSGQVMWSVGYSSRSGDRMATLSGHARRVMNEMITALRAQWYRQPQRGASNNTPSSPSQSSGSVTRSTQPVIRPDPPPPAPDFSVSDMGLREVQIQWPHPPAGYQIKVQRAEANEGPFQTVATQDGAKGLYRDREGLKDGTMYYYRLVTQDGLGQQSKPTVVKESMTAPPPAPPPEIRADAPAGRAVSLWWTASPGEGVVKYLLERRAAEEKEFTQVGESRELTFAEGGTSSSPLQDESRYVYRIRAVNRVGAVGKPSVEKEITTRPPPVPVQGLLATSDELRCIPLFWQQSPEEDVEKYELFRQSGDEDPELLATVKGRESVHYLDGDKNPGKLPDDTVYRYHLVAVNGVGSRSQPGEEVEAKTREPPPMVFGFEAVSGLPRRTTLSWMESDDEKVSGYILWRAEGDGEFEEMARLKGRELTGYEDDGIHSKKFLGGETVEPLKDETRYRYRIVAVNPAEAVSEIPAKTDAVTKALPPTPPAPRATSGLAGKIELAWEPTPGNDVAGYVLMAGADESHIEDLMRLEGVSTEESGLEPGETRCYALRVVDKDGLESLPSEVVNAESKKLPDPPSGLGSEGLTLKWQAPAQKDVVKYRIWEKKFIGKSEWAMTEETARTFTAEEIGRKKTFLLQSIDADGLESELSDAIEMRP
jgi:fibronectin type 3 domain-containing protein/TolB-like protein